MAQFKEITLHGTADRMIINLDRVLYLQRHAGYTSIHFDEAHHIAAVGSADQILLEAHFTRIQPE